ncbi:hypothetical protein TrLO_g6550 [Triparma laevis f. longispina]|uniref:Uncharacterized protein n=1 Tax=Triparma laevis f. longispina TaxID=1714387 RepID=A0A9W7FCH2_9STRA|nr:hypothetical protein TrLO_g6550 [Triparma laevis f. longispina]
MRDSNIIAALLLLSICGVLCTSMPPIPSQTSNLFHIGSSPLRVDESPIFTHNGIVGGAQNVKAGVNTVARRRLAVKGMVGFVGLLGLVKSWPDIVNLYSKCPSLKPLLNKCIQPLKLHPLGPLIFFIIFTIYASVGLSTTPVETISGYTFGFYKAALVNTFGKACGAMLAFLACRILKERRSVGGGGNGKTGEVSKPLNLGPFNPDSLTRMISSNPLRSTVLIRMSVLPELLKNYILATYGDLKLRTFYAGVLIHGGPYSVLWSYLGSELGKGGTGEMSPGVKVGVGLFGIMGLVGSPILIAKYAK